MNTFFARTMAIFSQIRSNITHLYKQSIQISVNLPGHEVRTRTALFVRTRKQLIARENGRCYICGRTEEESGSPLEGHHSPIERSLANAVDWNIVRKDFPDFDWVTFDRVNDPYMFVDDMLVNGILLCHDHHVGINQGIHYTTYPFWIIQRYMKSGYQYSDSEIIVHKDQDK